MHERYFAKFTMCMRSFRPFNTVASKYKMLMTGFELRISRSRKRPLYQLSHKNNPFNLASSILRWSPCVPCSTAASVTGRRRQRRFRRRRGRSRMPRRESRSSAKKKTKQHPSIRKVSIEHVSFLKIFFVNFLFHNSHDKFDRHIIVLNQINQIESQKE